jgi:beta-glucanase (GH16 family)
MMPTEEAYGGWAASGEIDIMEFKGQEPNIVHATIHHGKQWPNNKHTTHQMKLKKGNFTDDFHTFALEWEEGVMRWAVDGEVYHTLKEWSSSGGPFPAPFDQKFYIILNLAVGGGFVGNPNETTKYPVQYIVDYVRVYQRP